MYKQPILTASALTLARLESMGVAESLPCMRLNLILSAAALLAFNLCGPAGFGVSGVSPKIFDLFHHFQDISRAFSR